MLPQKAIEEYKKIYKKLYGKELSNEETGRRANNLVDLYRAVYGNNSKMTKTNESKEK